MQKKNGYLAYDLKADEEVMIHAVKEYEIDEIVGIHIGTCLHECRIIKKLDGN